MQDNILSYNLRKVCKNKAQYILKNTSYLVILSLTLSDDNITELDDDTTVFCRAAS